MTEPYRRDDITLLLIGLLAFYNAFLSILGPIMPYLRDDLGLTYTEGSLHFSAMAAGMIAGGWVGDRAVRYLGRRVATWLGGIGMCAGAAGLALGQNVVETVTSVFLLLGCAGSLVLIVIGSSLSDRHGANRTLAITEANIAASFGAGVTPLAIGAAVGIGIGWRWALVVPMLWLAILGARYRRTPFPPMTAANDQPGTHSPLPQAFWAYWATVVLVVGIEFAMIYFGADFLREIAGLSKDAASTTMSLFLWGMFAGRIAGRRLLNRRSASTLLPVALAITAVGFAIAWIWPQPLLSIAGLFVAGIGVATCAPLSSALAYSAAASQSNAAGARLSFASGSAILIAPLALGALGDSVGLRVGFLIVPVLVVSAIATARLGKRIARPHLPAQAIAPTTPV